MPARQLSAAEWDFIVRAISDVRHYLVALNGNTFVEGGIPLDEADDNTSFRMDTTADVHALDAVLRTLGYDSAVERSRDVF